VLKRSVEPYLQLEDSGARWNLINGLNSKNGKALKKPRKIVNYAIKKVKEFNLAYLFLPHVPKK